MFTYEADQHSSLSTLKVRQVDGALQANTIRGTTRVTTTAADGAVHVSEVQQDVQVLQFQVGWSVEVFSGWNGFTAKEWKFYIGGKTFHRGIFATKSGVSGAQVHTSVQQPLGAFELGMWDTAAVGYQGTTSCRWSCKTTAAAPITSTTVRCQPMSPRLDSQHVCASPHATQPVRIQLRCPSMMHHASDVRLGASAVNAADQVACSLS